MKMRSYMLGIVILITMPQCMMFAKANETEKVSIMNDAPIIKINEKTTKQVFYQDLDGDQKVEKIVILAGEVEDCVMKATVKINNKVMNSTRVWEGGDPTAHIIDIDIKDGKKELAIGGDLCSSDFATYFYGYSNGKLVDIGETQGVIEPVQLDKAYQMKLLGDGQIVTYERGAVLQTWYHDAIYRLTKSRNLELQPKTFYDMNTKVTVLHDLNVYTKPSLQAPLGSVLKVGTQGTLTLTDDKVWCQIEANGYKGWFKVDEWDNIGGTGHFGGKIFDGLFFAD